MHSKSLLSKLTLVAAAVSATFVAPEAYSGVMHSDVSIQTYTDFGQNMGRYVVGGKVNALLEKIRTDAGGITIPYTDGQADRVVMSNEQGMINFAGTLDGGHSYAIGSNFIATVFHNGSIDASFGNRTVGDNYAINYDTVDIRGCVDENNNAAFRLTPPGHDYMLQRQSKIFTDTSWNSLYTGVTDIDGNGQISKAEENTAIEGLKGSMMYHSGGGTMKYYDAESKTVSSLTSSETYITGAVNKIYNAYVYDFVEDDGCRLNTSANDGDLYLGALGEGADKDNPLPWGSRGGDSGSPGFIYNENTKQYEYVAALQSGPGNENSANSWSQFLGAVSWTQETLKSFDVAVNMSENKTVHLNAISTQGDTVTGTVTKDNVVTEYSTTIYSGKVTDANGNEIGISYNGIQQDSGYTWADLSDKKNTDNWYAYSGYLQKSEADLFFNSNLVFSSGTDGDNNIVLNDTVDLGAGYAEFNSGKYIITSVGSEGNLFNHAGYVINEGAEVHVKLVNPSDYMFEWRKNGAGDLWIDGTGDTNALLAVGGSGTTYLNQNNGYAGYNVLASSGATVQLTGGTGQIKRDFTFGSGGGTLDMYGNSMVWNNDNDATADGFTIHALTEEAVITNTTGTTTLTVTNPATSVDDSNVFLGSFKDTATGALKVVYDGGANTTWTLHSIHTNLTSNENSGFEVQSGTVVLSGINTIHAMGSATGTNANRLENPDDWHYADATMNVSVADGATFELGSHARLTGNVNVADGGTYIMREGVKHDQEYVEGGAVKEDVSQYSAFYGHHGNVSLASGANLQIAYNDGVTAAQTYAGKISGTGSLSVDLGNSGAKLTLSGDNSNFTGAKELTSGILLAEDVAALGDCTTEKWVVQQGGTLVLSEGISFSDVINDATGGVIALTSDRESQVSLNSVIGAYEGYTVNYGDSNTALQANSAGEWHLGGGGGTLVVDFLLQGDGTLVLGDGTSSGVVKLANTNNSFSGKIKLTDGVKLDFDDKSALGSGKVHLDYTVYVNDVKLTPDLMHADSVGAYYVDSFADEDLDFSNTPNLSLAAGADTTYTGNLTVDDLAAYRFGGGTGILTVATELSGEHDLVLDAQTRAGNKVVLAKAATLNGAVSVMGYDAAQSNGVTTGDMTLQLAVNDALAAASGVTLKAGATLDINGTAQSLKSLEVQAGAFVLDSAGAGELSVAGGTVVGSLQLGTLNVTGGNLALSGTTIVTDMNVNGGEVTLSGSGTRITNLKIGTGATFDIKNADASADSIGERISHVELAGGTLANTGDDNIGAGSRQFYSLTLTADSSINSAKQFGLIGTSHGVTDIKLNNHTLTKTGAGQFDIYNTSITSGKILVQKGTLFFNDNKTGHSSTIAASVSLLEGGSFEVWKDGAGTLTFSGSETQISELTVKAGSVNFSGSETQISSLTASAGSITFEAGSHKVTSSLSLSGGSLSLASGATLDLSAINIGGNAGVGMINKILNATSGAGTLKLQTSSQAAAAVLDASAAVHTNVETGALYLNSWKTQNSVVTLHEDSSLTVDNELYVQSTANLRVDGGTLSAGTITLGHGSWGNTGTLELISGSITTTSLKQANVNDTANAFTMTGGTLEFTQNDASAIAAGIQLSISGGTLKAAESSWHVDRAMTLGDVTIVAEGDNKIAFNGDVSVTAGSSLQIASEGISTKNLTLESGAQIVVDLADFASAIEAREGDSVTLTILSGATITFGTEAVAVASALATADGTNYAQYLTVKDTSGKYSSFSSSWTYTKGQSLTLSVVVPESSAFGLLAGLSALALCVSRRRRKSR